MVTLLLTPLPDHVFLHDVLLQILIGRGVGGGREWERGERRGGKSGRGSEEGREK